MFFISFNNFFIDTSLILDDDILFIMLVFIIIAFYFGLIDISFHILLNKYFKFVSDLHEVQFSLVGPSQVGHSSLQ